ncbi:MAG: hypothetical protein V2A61_02280 [Calditrichota bacterium]
MEPPLAGWKWSRTFVAVRILTGYREANLFGDIPIYKYRTFNMDRQDKQDVFLSCKSCPSCWRIFIISAPPAKTKSPQTN